MPTRRKATITTQQDPATTFDMRRHGEIDAAPGMEAKVADEGLAMQLEWQAQTDRAVA